MSDRETWRLIEELYRAEFVRFVRVAGAITEDRESAVEAVQEGFADAIEAVLAVVWSGRAWGLGLELRGEPGPQGEPGLQVATAQGGAF